MSLARAAVACLVLLLASAAPTNAHAQTSELQRAGELVKRGELDAALKSLDTIIAAHPKDPRARFLKGVALGEQHRVDEAIAVYTGIISDYPELPEPYNNLAALYALQGRYALARDALERAVSAQPSYATAHENLGDIYLKLAAQSYAKAVELEPGRASAQHKLKIVSDLVSAAPAAATTSPKP